MTKINNWLNGIFNNNKIKETEKPIREYQKNILLIKENKVRFFPFFGSLIN